MKIPALLASLLLLAASALADSPIKLGPRTPEGFNDPAHLHFFRYQAYLVQNKLDGLDAAAWKALAAEERGKKVQAGEEWLKDKMSALMSSPYLNDADAELLAAVWGKDVASAAQAVSKSLRLGDPDQIKAARQKMQGLVKSVGGASVDWAAIFDGAAPGAVAAPNLPNPLGVKTPQGFMASLDSPEVRAPLASRTTFVQFLEKKNVPADAFPALIAMYDVLSRAREPERSETAHLLPTVVRFLNDGHRIVDEDRPGALAFAVPGEYDRPERVGITSLVRASDPVAVGDVLAHEFEHVYDMYSGRYYTLDSELRGFKTNVLFYKIMRGDPQMSKKLDQLSNSDDDSTRGFFRDEAMVAASYAESPQAFADMVAFGHGYNQYEEGTFQGRLTLREAASTDTGLERQISGQKFLLARVRQESARLDARLAAGGLNDRDLEKTTKDLAAARSAEIRLQRDIAVSTLRLNRMRRELAWMDKRAANSGQTPPAYDLSLPVSKDYVVDGD